MGCLCKHPLHVSSDSLLLSHRILLSSVGKIQLHQSHRHSTSQFHEPHIRLPAFHSGIMASGLSNVAPPWLCSKATSNKMLQITEAHPNWPVYAVFEHASPQLASQHLSTQLRSGERTGSPLLWSLVNHTIVSDHTIRQPGFYLPSQSWSLLNHFQTGYEMWRCSNSTMFELQMFSADLKFDECFKRFVVKCKFVEKSLFHGWIHMHRQPESADKSVFFSQIQPITRNTVLNVQYNFCSMMCYPVLIWTLILLTLGIYIVTIILIGLNQCIMFQLIK